MNEPIRMMRPIPRRHYGVPSNVVAVWIPCDAAGHGSVALVEGDGYPVYIVSPLASSAGGSWRTVWTGAFGFRTHDDKNDAVDECTVFAHRDGFIIRKSIDPMPSEAMIEKLLRDAPCYRRQQ